MVRGGGKGGGDVRRILFHISSQSISKTFKSADFYMHVIPTYSADDNRFSNLFVG